MSKRIARLNEQLKRELTELIRREVRDPRVGVVTITGVETAGDLGSAKVFVRVVGDRAALTESLDGLVAAAPFLRTRLGQMLRVRKVPELRFREDRSFDHAQRIEQVLADILPEAEADDTEESSSEEGDSERGDADGGDSEAETVSERERPDEEPA